MRRKLWLVHQYLGTPPTPDNLSSAIQTVGLEWTIATREAIDRLFQRDPKRLLLFQHFLSVGYVGVVLFQGHQWVTYAWMAPPNKSGPPHLPRWAGKLGCHWIFYCHTKQSHRGRGLYKLALRLLILEAFRAEAEPPIFIDTQPANYASRRAILAVGFIPRGTIDCYYLWIPKYMERCICGTWHKQRDHPHLTAPAALR